MLALKKTKPFVISVPVLNLTSIKDSNVLGEAGCCSHRAVQHNLAAMLTSQEYRALLQILLLLHGCSPRSPVKCSTGAGGRSEGFVEKPKVFHAFEVCLAVSTLKHGFFLVTVTKSSKVLN